MGVLKVGLIALVTIVIYAYLKKSVITSLP